MSAYITMIVPCYNVQDYLEQCLDSFVADAARLEDEVILVDDGSTDNTPLLCDRYARAYGHIRVIHQKNGGLSAARNTGIEAATGDYLEFVDSDDWMEPGALDALHQALAQKPDVLLINVNRYRQGDLVSSSNYHAGMLAQGWDAFLDGYIRKYAVNGQAQCLVIRRDLVQQQELRFHEGILHEDMEWTPLALCACRSGAVLEQPVYGYRLAREGSIMAGLDETALERRQCSCVEAARVLAGESTQAQTPERKRCLMRSAGLVLSQALHYAAQREGTALHDLSGEIRQDILLSMAVKKMPRRMALCTGLLGVEKGTKLYRSHLAER